MFQKSKIILKFKYLFVLLLLSLTCVACGVKSSTQNNTAPTTSQIENTMAKGAKPYIVGLDTVPFTEIDKVPIFPGCESFATIEEQKKCLSAKVQNHIMQNFDPSIGKKHKITGMIQVIIQFEINKEGNIVNARAKGPHPKIEEVAIRVIASLPNISPGEYDGKKVGINYTVPIAFWNK